MQIGDWARSSSLASMSIPRISGFPKPLSILNMSAHSNHRQSQTPLVLYVSLQAACHFGMWPGSCICSSDATQRRTADGLLLHGLHGNCWKMKMAGFPNSYTFRMMGFHYLMIRSSGHKAQQDDLFGFTLRCLSAQHGQIWYVRCVLLRPLLRGTQQGPQTCRMFGNHGTTAVARFLNFDTFLLFTWGLWVDVGCVGSFPAWNTGFIYLACLRPPLDTSGPILRHGLLKIVVRGCWRHAHVRLFPLEVRMAISESRKIQHMARPVREAPPSLEEMPLVADVFREWLRNLAWHGAGCRKPWIYLLHQHHQSYQGHQFHTSICRSPHLPILEVTWWM